MEYISNGSRRFKIFVANRVQLIHDNTNKNHWGYVATNMNPSDAASRGITMEDKHAVDIWLNDPKILWENNKGWKEKFCRVLNE